MELGQRLRQARLEKGLSQRQLCGQEITRNMLSQIENGSARPSMDTLCYLAARLEKPVGYFLEEQAVTSPNQQVMERARQAEPEQVLEILKQYRPDDPVFDRERWLLEALACMDVARQALSQGKRAYGAILLERCAAAGEQTPYYTRAMERERILLCNEADGGSAAVLEKQLEEDPRELLLRAQARWEQADAVQAEAYLQAVTVRDDRWYTLMGRCRMAQQDYKAAAQYLEQVKAPGMQIFGDLEACYRELEDYKMAYFYACKQKGSVAK